MTQREKYMSNKLQDDHADEVRRFVGDLVGYIDQMSVKIVIDVGSRDARESISLKSYFQYAVVYAFECNPDAIELCKQNIGDRADITLVPKAVSDVNGIVDFFPINPEKTVTSHADGNIGASSLFVANPDYPYEKFYQNKITVESITLKRWAEEAGVRHIDIMWIDLQGAEMKAFCGMGDLISRTKIIHTEVEFREVYLGQPLFKDIDRYLAAKGFCLLKLDSSDWFGNAVYIRKDLAGGIGLVRLYASKYFSLGRFGLFVLKRWLVNPMLVLKRWLVNLMRGF